MKKRLSKKALISVCTLIAVLLVLIIWTIWGNTALMVSTVTVSSNRIPAAFNGFRIAQVSDLLKLRASDFLCPFLDYRANDSIIVHVIRYRYGNNNRGEVYIWERNFRSIVLM